MHTGVIDAWRNALATGVKEDTGNGAACRERRRKEITMSQRREKRKRRERHREYALELRRWQHNEPPKILFWRWRKWYRSKPTLKDGGHWSVKGTWRMFYD